VDWHTPVETALGWIRGAGPWTFFSAMALLPAAGVPMLTFTLTAGSAFGQRMGMPAVVAASLVATVTNLALTYWLARRALRPWLTKFIVRMGYRMPEVESGDITDLIVILRMTTGIPFFVQNYLLGLADAPVGRYLAVSCALVLPQTAAFIVFGDALLHGKGRAIFISIGVLAVLVAASHLVRRHWNRTSAGTT